VRKIETIRAGRSVADHRRLKSVARDTARDDCISPTLEPNRLVSERRQHLLVTEQPFSFALDNENNFAAPKRQR